MANYTKQTAEKKWPWSLLARDSKHYGFKLQMKNLAFVFNIFTGLFFLCATLDFQLPDSIVSCKFLRGYIWNMVFVFFIAMLRVVVFSWILSYNRQQ